MPSILEPFFARLELETLQALNAQVSYEGKDPREVARKFLVAQGLLDE
ncbi:MAG: hypothetical protein JW923_04455 [Spirochaetales bacterium]|nr:hypothetical protein [Spirochaetales bacterium]